MGLQPKSVPESMLWRCLQEQAVSIEQKARRAVPRALEVWQADLLVGNAADFWAWLVDFGGVMRWRIFCFRLPDFTVDFFGRFFFSFCDSKNPPKKSTTFMVALWKVFHSRLKPRPAVEQIPSSALVPFLKLKSGLSATPEAWQPLLWKSRDKQALSLTGW